MGKKQAYIAVVDKREGYEIIETLVLGPHALARARARFHLAGWDDEAVGRYLTEQFVLSTAVEQRDDVQGRYYRWTGPDRVQLVTRHKGERTHLVVTVYPLRPPTDRLRARVAFARERRAPYKRAKYRYRHDVAWDHDEQKEEA